MSLTRKGSAERAAYDRLSDRLAASMLEALDEAERSRLTAAMGEVERLIRAASVEVAAEAPDSADARRCLDAYFRELAARFEGGFDAAKDDSARADDMAPPSGLFVDRPARRRCRSDAAASSASDKTTGEIKRVWTAPVRPRHRRRSPGAQNARSGGARRWA